MQIPIHVDPSWRTADDVLTSLQTEPEIVNALITLHKHEERAIETAVLVATVTAVGAGISALVKGLLAVSTKLHGKTIIVKGKHGASIEFPVDTPPEKVDWLIQQAKKLDSLELYLER